MKSLKWGAWILSVIVLAGCANTGQPPPQANQVSQQELDRLWIKGAPNLPLEEVVKLSKNGQTPTQIIQRIKETNSTYDLTPTQVLDLSKQGVNQQVLEYIHTSREAFVRNNVADELNKREFIRQQQELNLRRQMMMSPMYDPFMYGGFYRYPYGSRFGLGGGMRFGW